MSSFALPCFVMATERFLTQCDRDDSFNHPHCLLARFPVSLISRGPGGQDRIGLTRTGSDLPAGTGAALRNKSDPRVPNPRVVTDPRVTTSMS